MLKAYTLAPAYKDTLIGGTVVAGPQGESLDVMKALEEGDGEILTEDHVLQSVLENYYGQHGLVLESAIVDQESGNRTPVEVPDPAESLAQASVLPAVPVGTAASSPAAEHADGQSDYGTFSADELRDTLSERSIEFAPKATKDQMVSLLQQDDERRAQELQEGETSNGS